MTATAVRGRASLAVKQRDLLKEELRARQAEDRELADEVIPLSAYLWRRAAIDGDPTAKAAAGRVVYLAKRLSERSGGGDAA